MNINSIRNKFPEVKEALFDKCIVDICTFAETKIDNSFPDSQFYAQNYCIYRRDRTARGGGLLTYVRSDVPSRRRKDLETETCECITVEITVGRHRWLIYSVYRPPDLSNNIFKNELSRALDKGLIACNNVILIGDLNYDLLSIQGNTLNEILNDFDLINLIKDPTCHTQTGSTLLDVLCTNKPLSFVKCGQCSTGISDYHDFIYGFMKLHMKPVAKKFIKYRSYKNFSEQDFITDVSHIPFHVTEVLDDYDDQYWMFSKLLLNIVNEHAPIKTKKARVNEAPYVTAELRKAIRKKKMLWNKFKRQKSDKNWEKYRKQRNHVTDLRKKAVKSHFTENCDGGAKNQNFWKTIKPFLSNKGYSQDNYTIQNGGSIVTDPQQICDIFNEYFVNIVSDIGTDTTISQQTVSEIKQKYANHRSVLDIQNHVGDIPKWDLCHTDTGAVSKLIQNY